MTHEQVVVAMKPFAQVEAHLARSQEGAGLGLPLAIGIARLHGGSIHLDSQPGAGTTVMVTLPRAAASLVKAGKAA
jgi:signal transduction histidine kinase